MDDLLTDGKNPIGRCMLAEYVAVNEKLRAKYAFVNAAQNTPVQLPAMKSETTQTDQHSINPTLAAASQVISRQEPVNDASWKTPIGGDPTDLGFRLRWLHERLSRGELLIAPSRGWGTRAEYGQRSYRNQDFTFERGELLLCWAGHDKIASSHHNGVVINSRGEIGDIRASLVERVDRVLDTKMQNVAALTRKRSVSGVDLGIPVSESKMAKTEARDR